MAALITKDAAAAAGVNVQKFHRLAAKYGIVPALEAPGLRGAKFWHPADVARIARLAAEVAA